MSVIKEYLDLIVAILTTLSAVTTVVVYYVKRGKSLKNAKTDEERQKIINEIKSKTIGLITVAESLFSSVPKSGTSKLLYVLDKVKSMCLEKGIEYESEAWETFVNEIVNGYNGVLDEKAIESEKARIIENVKTEIPFFIRQADELFSTIPDSFDYKLEYILKNISVACEKHPVNVYDLYDWRAYIKSQYENVSVGA